MSTYRLTKKAEHDLDAIVEFFLRQSGPQSALRQIDELEARIEALARHDFEGPEVVIRSRARPVRRWPVPPYWVYYDRSGGRLRVLRLYHGARKPL